MEAFFRKQGKSSLTVGQFLKALPVLTLKGLGLTKTSKVEEVVLRLKGTNQGVVVRAKGNATYVMLDRPPTHFILEHLARKPASLGQLLTGLPLARGEALASVNALLAAGTLWCEFRTDKLTPYLQVREPGQAAPLPAAFAEAFAEAFERLDRQQGRLNFVSLVSLRQALSAFDRGGFDHGLAELRRQRRFSLSPAEGRYGVTAEERTAGIPEGHTLLLFVSRVEE